MDSVSACAMGDERICDFFAPLASQLFEHSLALMLLTSASTAQIVFTMLLKQCNVYMDVCNPPFVSFADWVAMVDHQLRLDSGGAAVWLPRRQSARAASL